MNWENIINHLPNWVEEQANLKYIDNHKIWRYNESISVFSSKIEVSKYKTLKPLHSLDFELCCYVMYPFDADSTELTLDQTVAQAT